MVFIYHKRVAPYRPSLQRAAAFASKAHEVVAATQLRAGNTFSPAQHARPSLPAPALCAHETGILKSLYNGQQSSIGASLSTNHARQDNNAGQASSATGLVAFAPGGAPGAIRCVSSATTNAASAPDKTAGNCVKICCTVHQLQKKRFYL